MPERSGPLPPCRRFHICLPGYGLRISNFSTFPVCSCPDVWNIGMLRTALGGSRILYLVSFSCFCKWKLFVSPSLIAASYRPSVVRIVPIMSVAFLFPIGSLFPTMLVPGGRFLRVVSTFCFSRPCPMLFYFMCALRLAFIVFLAESCLFLYT